MTKPGTPPPAEQGPTGGPREIVMRPIGVIRTPFTVQAGTPIQASFAAGVEGTVELEPGFVEGLADLDGFSHVILVYAFHLASGFNLRVKPYLDTKERGIFATRAPRRPNPIGLSVVRLLGIEGSRMRVADVDMLDGTPLLDIKPFVPDFDHRQAGKTGWYRHGAEQGSAHSALVADSRFEPIAPGKGDTAAGAGRGPGQRDGDG
jgi:tRNA-Thr(GGU) m(6)t(6)A37 methyltransferase TsaA